jgi:hypothetical protein
MKYLLTALLLILFISILGKPNAQTDDNAIVQLTETVHAETLPEPVKEVVQPPEVKAKPVPVKPTPKVSTDCYAAIKRQWPQKLWAGAKLVVDGESGGRSSVIGATNYDGSNDYGCFQINKGYHSAWFATHNWKDADQNAAYGYLLYQERGNWTAWYAVRGILW